MTNEELLALGFDPEAVYEWKPLYRDPFQTEPVMLKVSAASSYWQTDYPEKSGPMVYTVLADTGQSFAKGTPNEVRATLRKVS